MSVLEPASPQTAASGLAANWKRKHFKAAGAQLSNDLSAHFRRLWGTSLSKTAGNQRSTPRSGKNCHTRVSHSVGQILSLSACHRGDRANLDCRTAVYHSRGFGVWRRGTIFQFRIRVPADVRVVIGRTHLSRSLKTDSLTVANRLAAVCALEATASFDLARQAPRTKLLGTIPTGPVIPSSIPFEELCGRYLNDPTASRTAKSVQAYRGSLSMLIELVGADTPISTIDRALCRDVMGVLTALPRNARKRWPNTALREVAREAAAADRPAMSASNVNEHMNKLSTVLNWGVREEFCAANAAKGLRLPNVRSAKERRRAFSSTQLQRIFNAPLYRGCIDDERHYAVVGESRPRRSRFWVQLLSLFGGLRLNEACQLLVDDVREDRGVLCIRISADSNAKSIKTAASSRLVPVHPELHAIGFENFVRSARSTGQVRLFDEIKLDCFGMHSGGFSRWFARFLATCDAVQPLTCFHSFRHSFRDALRNGGVNREIALALGGWTVPSGFNAVGDAYGDGFDPRVLLREIEKVRYHDLVLDHLKRSA